MLYLFNEQTNNAFIKLDYCCIICVMYTIYVGVGGGVIQLGNYGKSSTFGHPECPPLIIIELVSNSEDFKYIINVTKICLSHSEDLR